MVSSVFSANILVINIKLKDSTSHVVSKVYVTFLIHYEVVKFSKVKLSDLS